MTRQLRMLLVALALFSGGMICSSAEACPMCKAAVEDDDKSSQAVPKAYMYSILFMLAMPASLATVFGVSFYRLARKQSLINEEMLAAIESGNVPSEDNFTNPEV